MLRKLFNRLLGGNRHVPTEPLVTEPPRDPEKAQKKYLRENHQRRLPPFPAGIKVHDDDINELILTHKETLDGIRLALGLAGHHNADEYHLHIVEPVRHLANLIHFLPASEATHYVELGGLFEMSLELALHSIRSAERKCLTQSTPEEKSDNESLWTYAAFLNGLFSEAVKTLAKITVYDIKNETLWVPGTTGIYEWARQNKVSEYHIVWLTETNKALIHQWASSALPVSQLQKISMGEPLIKNALVLSLNSAPIGDDEMDIDTFRRNPLLRMHYSLRYKLVDRDINSRAEFHGQPLAGMHLEPWLIDAMRQLLSSQYWQPNTANGRVWCGEDGIYLIWPQGINDLIIQLKDNGSPYMPSSPNTLTEILLNAGIIDDENGGYLFNIQAKIVKEDSETGKSEEKLKTLQAIRFKRKEVLFGKAEFSQVDYRLLQVVGENNGAGVVQPEAITGQSPSVVESVQMDEVVTASMGINFEPQKTVFTEHTSPPATKPVSKPQVVDIKGLFSIDKTPKIEPSQQVVDDSPNQYPNDFEDLLNSPYGEVEQVNLKNLFSE
jgi:hypothetical protein